MNTTDVGPDGNDQYITSIARLGDGYVVVWYDNSANGGDTSDVATLKAQRYDILGNKLGGEITIDSSETSEFDGTFLATLPPKPPVSATETSAHCPMATCWPFS